MKPITVGVLLLALAGWTGCAPIERTPPGSNVGEVAPVESYDRVSLGTALHWEANPQQASELAARDAKLLLTLHLSGDFAAFEST